MRSPGTRAVTDADAPSNQGASKEAPSNRGSTPDPTTLFSCFTSVGDIPAWRQSRQWAIRGGAGKSAGWSLVVGRWSLVVVILGPMVAVA
jgi:hypothetical protein